MTKAELAQVKKFEDFLKYFFWENWTRCRNRKSFKIQSAGSLPLSCPFTSPLRTLYRYTGGGVCLSHKLIRLNVPLFKSWINRVTLAPHKKYSKKNNFRIWFPDPHFAPRPEGGEPPASELHRQHTHEHHGEVPRAARGQEMMWGKPPCVQSQFIFVWKKPYDTTATATNTARRA